jgi:hypothetical protein
MSEKPESVINNWQFRDAYNIGYNAENEDSRNNKHRKFKRWAIPSQSKHPAKYEQYLLHVHRTIVLSRTRQFRLNMMFSPAVFVLCIVPYVECVSKLSIIDYTFGFLWHHHYLHLEAVPKIWNHLTARQYTFIYSRKFLSVTWCSLVSSSCYLLAHLLIKYCFISKIVH